MKNLKDWGQKNQSTNVLTVQAYNWSNTYGLVGQTSQKQVYKKKGDLKKSSNWRKKAYAQSHNCKFTEEKQWDKIEEQCKTMDTTKSPVIKKMPKVCWVMKTESF